MGGGPEVHGSPETPATARPFLRVSIDSPTVKLNLSSDSPEQALADIRKIVEALHATEEIIPDDDVLGEVRGRLTEEFLGHPLLAARLQNAVALDEDVRVLKRLLPLVQVLDLESGQATTQLDAGDTKAIIAELFQGLAEVRDCIVHLRGDLTREQQCVVMDAVKQRLTMSVQPRFFSTKRDLEGSVLLEAVCFGHF